MSPEEGSVIERVIIEIVGRADSFMDTVRESTAKAKEELLGVGTAAQRAASQVTEAMALVRDLAATIGGSLEKSADILVNSGHLTREAADDAVAGLKRLETQTKKTAAGTSTLTKGLKFLARGLLGLTALGAIRMVARFVKEATEAFSELSFEQFRLAVGVRAAQRRIGEQVGTMEEWLSFVEQLRVQFGIFSRKDLSAATAKVLLLTRELGFTQQQIEDVTRASIILAEVTGRDVEDTARRLTLFLDTGYSRGLAQLGVQISSITVKQSEYVKSLDKTWEEMTRAERATASLNVALEQIAALVGDAGRAAETFQGRMQAMEADQEDAMAAMGERTSALVLAWNKVKTFFITDVIGGISVAVQTLIQIITIMVIQATAGFTFLVVAGSRLMQEFIEGTFNFGQALTDASRVSEEAAQIMAEQLGELFPEDFAQDVGDEMGAFAEALEEGEDATGDFAEAVEDALDDVRMEVFKTQQKMSDANDDLIRDLEDLSVRFRQTVADLATDLDRDLAKINRSLSDTIAQARIALGRKLQDIAIDANQKIQDAQADFRRKELQEQEDFALKMRRLNEDFLLNIQDAVRERDARRILDLVQQKGVDSARLIEDFAIARQRRLDAFRQEVADIKLQARRKAQEAKIAFERQKQDAARRAAIQRRERLIQNAQELEDAVLHNARMRREAIRDYQRKLLDLQKYLQQRINILAFALQQEFDLTAAALNDLLRMLNDVVGENGMVVQMLNAAMMDINAGLSTGIDGALGTETTTPGMAEGGVVVADKATTVTFGEAGKELAAFIPLDRLHGDSPVLASLAGENKEGGRVQVIIGLDPGLVAEVVEESIGGVADLIIEMNEPK